MLAAMPGVPLSSLRGRLRSDEMYPALMATSALGDSVTLMFARVVILVSAPGLRCIGVSDRALAVMKRSSKRGTVVTPSSLSNSPCRK
jgi:hypothetical protein